MPRGALKQRWASFRSQVDQRRVWQSDERIVADRGAAFKPHAVAADRPLVVLLENACSDGGHEPTPSFGGVALTITAPAWVVMKVARGRIASVFKNLTTASQPGLSPPAA